MKPTGKGGEEFAVRTLLDLGCRIIAVNHHSRYGEIDIIAVDGETIRFVEVKTRRTGAQVGAELSVTPAKQRKIIKTALLYLQETGCDLQPRFDLFAVTTDSAGVITGYDYMTGVFDGEAYAKGH